jgi:hypothetical protein
MAGMPRFTVKDLLAATTLIAVGMSSLYWLPSRSKENPNAGIHTKAAQCKSF